MILPEWLTGIQIKTAVVPPVLPGATARGVLWQAAAGRFLLEVPEVARYLATDGRKITIEPVTQAKEEDVTRFLRMTPLAALLFQRGILAFHATAVANKAGAVLLAGDSGTGKSTLAAALLQRGWSLLSDELAVVDTEEQGRLVVLPTFPEIMLWPDAMAKLDIASGNGADGARQALSMPTQFAAVPRPLRAIYWLGVSQESEIERSDVTGVQRFNAIGRLTYKSHIADALFDRARYLRQTAAIAQAVPLYRLGRPRDRWSVEELIDKVASE